MSAASRLFRHNNLRDILGHAAKGAGLSAVVIEKKHQLAESKKKPGDITVQQYHHGFWSVTVAHPLQKKHIEVAARRGGAGGTRQEVAEGTRGLQGRRSTVRAIGVGVDWRRDRDGARDDSQVDRPRSEPRRLPSVHHSPDALLPSFLLLAQTLGAGCDRPSARACLLPSLLSAWGPFLVLFFC